MDAWKYEYAEDKENYTKLFDECMKENQIKTILGNLFATCF